MFDWTDKMKNVGATRELEDQTRIAVIKAVHFLSELPDDTHPSFTGNSILVPTNETATKMQDAITAHLSPEIVGAKRAMIVSTAVHAAMFACKGGKKGADAWAQLVDKLSAK